jgi:hypothetical protein
MLRKIYCSQTPPTFILNNTITLQRDYMPQQMYGNVFVLVVYANMLWHIAPKLFVHTVDWAQETSMMCRILHLTRYMSGGE